MMEFPTEDYYEEITHNEFQKRTYNMIDMTPSDINIITKYYKDKFQKIIVYDRKSNTRGSHGKICLGGEYTELTGKFSSTYNFYNLYIYKLDDDYYLTFINRRHMALPLGNTYYLCDQLDGLKKWIDDLKL